MDTDTLPLTNQYECRLCFDPDSIDNLIYPCKCSGTSKYIHKRCLDEWRTLADNRDAYKNCFECGHEYQFKNNDILETKCCDSFIKKISKNIVIFTIFNFIIISLISLFLFTLDKNKELMNVFVKTNTTDVYEGENIICYLIWGSLSYLLLLLFLFMGLFLNVKNKKLYCKHYCHNKNAYLFIIALLIMIVITMNIIFGLFILSIGLQYLLNNHMYTMEKLKEAHNMEILNYDSTEYE